MTGPVPSLPRALPSRSAPVGQKFPGLILGAAAFLLLGLGFGPNLNLAILSVAVLVAGCVLLRRPGESPFLAVTFCLHWLGASVAIFHANWLGIDIIRYSEFGGDMEQATVLSLVGLLALAIGMRIGLGPWRLQEAERARSIAFAQPVIRWFHLYCIVFAVSFGALAAEWIVPGLSQVTRAVAELRWAFVFVLAYVTFVRGGVAGPYFPLVFGVELGLSLGTYFSDFRTIFLFTIFAAFASGLRLNARMQAGLAVLVAALLGLGLVWTGIKQEYRDFISEGQKEQVVAVDYATRMAKFAALAGALDARAIEAGFDQMLHRVTYVEYFSVVLGHVPSAVDHTNGALLIDALARPFQPRAFFPDKAIIDDTDRTNIYTGGLAGTYRGTSISIGYIGEAYIDFGIYGMMLALCGIGYGYGYGYRLLMRAKACGSLVGMGLATAALQPIGLLETSFTKVAGGLAVSLLVSWLFLKLIGPLKLGWIAGRRT